MEIDHGPFCLHVSRSHSHEMSSYKYLLFYMGRRGEGGGLELPHLWVRVDEMNAMYALI